MKTIFNGLRVTSYSNYKVLIKILSDSNTEDAQSENCYDTSAMNAFCTVKK